MEKKYQVLTLEIEKSGNLNLDKLSEMEKTKVLENRDIIYVYFGKKISILVKLLTFYKDINNIN